MKKSAVTALLLVIFLALTGCNRDFITDIPSLLTPSPSIDIDTDYFITPATTESVPMSEYFTPNTVTTEYETRTTETYLPDMTDVVTSTVCPDATSSEPTISHNVLEGVYLGLEQCGNDIVLNIPKEKRKHTFLVNGTEAEYMLSATDTFDLQNSLKIGYLYKLLIVFRWKIRNTIIL